MKTVVLTLFNFEDLPFPILKRTSKKEPNRTQIEETIKILLEAMVGSKTDFEYVEFKQKGSLKMYVYKVGEKDLVVTVERADIREFD